MVPNTISIAVLSYRMIELSSPVKGDVRRNRGPPENTPAVDAYETPYLGSTTRAALIRAANGVAEYLPIGIEMLITPRESTLIVRTAATRKTYGPLKIAAIAAGSCR